MQTRNKLVNSNQVWNEKRRYKISEVVSINGNIYQNTTGINSNPMLNVDWILIKKLDLAITQYHVDFIADATGLFQVPDGIYIGNVFVNNIASRGDKWTQTLNTVQFLERVLKRQWQHL